EQPTGSRPKGLDGSLPAFDIDQTDFWYLRMHQVQGSDQGYVWRRGIRDHATDHHDVSCAAFKKFQYGRNFAGAGEHLKTSITKGTGHQLVLQLLGVSQQHTDSGRRSSAFNSHGLPARKNSNTSERNVPAKN